MHNLFFFTALNLSKGKRKVALAMRKGHRHSLLLRGCFVLCTRMPVIGMQAQYPGYKPVADMAAFRTQFAAAAQAYPGY